MGSSKRQSTVNDLSRKPGCPVPLPGGCLKGFPLPENFEDGVKMKCSNSSCKHQEQLIHVECFHALEENLIKIMSNIGSARGWTETQRRSNLWDKKGLTLIQKKCRCPCGLGLMSLDENAMFLARQNSTLSTGVHVKAKKGRNKNLPKLNFSSGPIVGSSGGKHISRRENKKRTNFRSESNNSSRSAASALALECYDRRHSGRVIYPVKQGSSPAWKDDFEFPVLVDDKPHPLNSFMITSKKADASMVHHVTSTPLSSRNLERKANQTLASCDFTVDSSSNSMSFTDEHPHDSRFLREVFTPESQDDVDDDYSGPSSFFYASERKYGSSESGQYVDSGLEVDVSMIMPSPPLSSPCEQDYECFQQAVSVCDSSESFSSQCRHYDLFSGPSFMLGELLVADISLPGAF